MMAMLTPAQNAAKCAGKASKWSLASSDRIPDASGSHGHPPCKSF